MQSGQKQERLCAHYPQRRSKRTWTKEADLVESNTSIASYI